MTPGRPQSPRNTSCWTSGSAVAPSMVRHRDGKLAICSIKLFFFFILRVLKKVKTCLQSTDSSVLILVGYSLSDMPVKAKRSALNYNLSITFNKAGEVATLFGWMNHDAS